MTALDAAADAWLRKRNRVNLVLLLMSALLLVAFLVMVAKNGRVGGAVAGTAFILLGLPFLLAAISGLRSTRRTRHLLGRSRWVESPARHGVVRKGTSVTDLVQLAARPGEVHCLGVRTEDVTPNVLVSLPIIQVAQPVDGPAGQLVVRAPDGRGLTEAKPPKDDRTRQEWLAAF